ncbi:MAG: transporter [Bacteroidales bacterium]|nr:transporter [Bacteroidales bacterium]MCF8458555.1 transporter [Bacteroidales bacterium]
MKNFTKLSYTTILVILFASAIFSQSEIPPLITDRPDQTESSVTVPKGSLQIETGYVFENTSKDYTSQSIAGTLLRFGLSNNLELRVGAGYMNDNYDEEINGLVADVLLPEYDFKGFTPFMIGAKINIGEENGIVPEMAILTEFTLGGTGDDVFYEDAMGTKVLFSFSHTLTDFLSFGYNLGAKYDGNQAAANLLYSFVLGASAFNKLGAFVEVYGSSIKNNLPDHRFDAGITYLLTDNLQLDLSGGIGLSDISPENFIGAGFSYRLMKK